MLDIQTPREADVRPLRGGEGTQILRRLGIWAVLGGCKGKMAAMDLLIPLDHVKNSSSKLSQESHVGVVFSIQVSGLFWAPISSVDGIPLVPLYVVSSWPVLRKSVWALYTLHCLYRQTPRPLSDYGHASTGSVDCMSDLTHITFDIPVLRHLVSRGQSRAKHPTPCHRHRCPHRGLPTDRRFAPARVGR